MSPQPTALMRQGRNRQTQEEATQSTSQQVPQSRRETAKEKKARLKAEKLGEKERKRE